MARPLRINYPGAVYHVTVRGNARLPIVEAEADRQRFVTTLASMVDQYQVLCHAWVLMDNHYHLLLETPQANLSPALRHLNGCYTQTFNRQHQRVGHLFQGRFKALVVEKEAYLLELCRYVVLNPVRAGLVTHPRQWRWSSYRATVGEQAAPDWLTTDWLLSQFGNEKTPAQGAYRRFVAEGMKQSSDPWTTVRHQLYLGSRTFAEQVSAGIPPAEDREIPLRQRFPLRYTLDEVLQKVAQAYEVELAALEQRTHRPSEARQLAIYAARQFAGQSLKEIGARFGLGYTAVSRRVRAMAARLDHEPRLQRLTKRLFSAKIKT